MKQSEMYSLYQRAQDALLTAEQKLAATFTKIDEEAKKFNWAAEAVKKMKELAAQDIMGKDTGKDLAEKFRQMGKTAVEAFKELSVELQSVKKQLKPEEFAAARKKLLTDLSNGLGIAAYLETASAARQLADAYKNLAIYAREAGLSQKQLTEAKNRARDALMKQSEYYSLYQKAQDSLLTTQQKLDQELRRITEEAKMWGWSKEITQRMKEFKFEELLGQQKTAAYNGNPRDSQRQNAALEYGTIAYYEAQMKDNKNLLDENKKQTRSLNNIESLTRWQVNRGSQEQHFRLIN